MRKNMKKVMATMLSATMMLGMASTTLAATITVENAVEKETYKAYKVFDVTNSGTNYAYTIAKNSQWKDLVEDYTVEVEADGKKVETNVFTLQEIAGDASNYVVKVTEDLFDDDSEAAAFAKYLAAEMDTMSADKTVKATEDGAVFADLEPGYYFVDTTLGALCALHTTVENQNVKEKNEIPTIEKEVDDNNVSIGDTVTFTLTVTDKKGTDTEIIVHDTMSEGLDLVDDSFEVKWADTTIEAGDDTFEIILAPKDNHCTFEIVFKEDLVKKLGEDDVVTITYNALINEDAEVDTEDFDNTWNKTWLNYSEQESTEKEVDLYTYKFGVKKVDGNGADLTGAEFVLYKNNDKIALVKDDDGFYRPATDEEVAKEGFKSAVIEAGEVVLKGFEANTYELEEIKAPNGYNMLEDRITIVLTKDGVEKTENDEIIYATGIDVVNETGAILPSTGGIGTTIFYVLGGLLVAFSGVVLFAKKRMSGEV